MKRLLKNKKGQGLIEYLIIVAIVAVGSMSIIKIVGGNLDVQFAKVASALGGKSNGIQAHEVLESSYKKRDFSNFFDGAVTAKSNKQQQ